MKLVTADLMEGAMMGAGPGALPALAVPLENWKPVPPLYLKWAVTDKGELLPYWKEAA